MNRDVFDYIDEDDDSPDRTNLVWNILTVVVLVMALCVGVIFLTIFVNPNAGINPFPPPTMPIAMELDTLTPTPKQVLPPTWTLTPTETLVPTSTNTPEPTVTLAPIIEATATETPEGAAASDMPFVLHEGNPQYIPNIYNSELGCNWMGVGGQEIGRAHV